MGGVLTALAGTLVEAGGSGDYILRLVAQDIGGLSDGDPISTWEADTGGNATAAGGARPTFKPGIQNGMAGARFNGSSNIIGGSISISGTALTVIAVAKLNSGTGSYARIVSLGISGTEDQSNTLYTASLLRHATNDAVGSFRNNGLLSTQSVTAGSTGIFCAVFDGTDNTVYVDGVAGTPVASSGTFGILNYALGSSVSNSDPGFFDGDIFEVRVYSSGKTSLELAPIFAELETTYGL